MLHPNCHRLSVEEKRRGGHSGLGTRTVKRKLALMRSGKESQLVFKNLVKKYGDNPELLSGKILYTLEELENLAYQDGRPEAMAALLRLEIDVGKFLFGEETLKKNH